MALALPLAAAVLQFQDGPGKGGFELRIVERDGRPAPAGVAVSVVIPETFDDPRYVDESPSPAQFGFLTARLDDRIGVARVARVARAKSPPGELVLAADRPLRARVRTADGRPAGGVRVALDLGWTDLPFENWIRETDESGAVDWPGTEALFAMRRADDPHWRIGYAVPGASASYVTVESGSFGAPILLQPYDVTAVQIEVRDETGRPVDDRQGVHDVSAWCISATGEPLLNGNTVAGSVEARVEEGRGLLGPIAAGTRLRVYLDTRERFALAEFVVPSGGTAPAIWTIRLQRHRRETAGVPPVPGRNFKAFGRLVDEAGQPLDATDLSASRFCRSGTNSWRWCPVDRVVGSSDGRFRLSNGALHGSPEPGELFIGPASGTHGSWRLARISLPMDPEAFEIDFGDVVVPPADVVAAGRVVDESGGGIEGAYVGVVPAGPMFFAHDAMFASMTPVGDLQGETDAEGRFEIRGHADFARASIEAGVDGEGGDRFSNAATPPFAVGSHDVRIVLPQSGVITGRVRLPRSIPPQTVRIVVVDHHDSANWFGDRERSITADGSFHLRLVPGVTAVEFWHKPGDDISSRLLARIHDVEVVAGARVADPRLTLLALDE